MFLGVNLSAQNKNPESAVRHLSHFNSTTGLVTNKNVIAISTANIEWLDGTFGRKILTTETNRYGRKNTRIYARSTVQKCR